MTKFYQEIYNEEGRLVELHEKYPVDKGRRNTEQNVSSNDHS